MSGAIATLLASDPGDPATLGDAEFLAWLRDRFADAVRDEAFRLRLEIRGLWLANPELLAARERLDEAEREFRSSPESAELERMADELRGAEAAVEGITLAVIEGRSDDDRKLVHYEQQVAALQDELERRRAASEPHRRATR